MPIKKVILIFVLYAIGAIVFESVQEVEGHKKTPYNLLMLQTDVQSKQNTEDIYRKGASLVYSGYKDRGNALMDSAFLLSNKPLHLEWKARVNLRNGYYGEAMRSLNKAIDLFDDKESVGYRAWINFIYLHEYEEAITDFDRYEAMSPEPSFAYAMSVTILKGMTYKKMGDYPKAIESLTNYIDSTAADIVDIYAWWYRGMAWFEMGEVEKAIKDYDVFIDKYPNGPEAHFHKGLALLSQEKTPQACKCFKKSEKLIRKGYRRAYIWHSLPDELHLTDTQKMIEEHCSKNK